MSPALSYWTIQPDCWTFGAAKLRHWVETHLDGRVLNACAGQTHLNHGDRIVRNDIDPEINADTHYDIRDLPTVLDGESFDTVVLDPPFTNRQAAETYNLADTNLTPDALAAAVDALLKPGGRLIHFGYGTSLMPLGEEYAPEELAIWNTLGRQYDWLATLTRKPMSEETVDHARPLNVTDTAIPNEHATATGDVATSGNSNTAITLDYRRLGSSPSLREGIVSYVAEHLSGRVLDVSCAERSLHYGDHIVQTSVDESVDATYHFDERRLSHEFAPEIFETVLLDLPSEAFQQTVSYGGQTTGRDTALKQEVHRLVTAGGRIIQVGHTATCMPQRFDYRRDHVAVINHPDAAQDVIVSIDIKQNTGLDALTTDRSPRDIHIPDSDAEARHTCIRCGVGWYLDPVWYVDCPVCGARPGNYCVSDDGAILHHAHPHRRDSLEEHHERHECEPGVATTLETNTVDQDDRDEQLARSNEATTEQGILTQFANQ